MDPILSNTVYPPAAEGASDIAVFVLKRDVKLQPTNQPTCSTLLIYTLIFAVLDLWLIQLQIDWLRFFSVYSEQLV